MRKYMMAAVCVLAAVALCHAQGFKLGAHGAYTAGGDVEEEEFGMGAQLVAGFNENVSLELAGTWIEDEAAVGDFDFFNIALSLRLHAAMEGGFSPYIGGGVNYMMFDFDDVADPDDEMGFHACAGVDIPLGENVELFAEYRYTWVEYTVESGGGDVEFEEIGSDFDYEIGMIRAGLNLVL